MRYLVSLMLVVMMAALIVAGEKSSLLKSGKTAPPPVVNERGEEVIPTTAATVANTSLIAVKKPEPRKFQLHDHVTILVREESTSKTTADASNDKAVKLAADLKEWLKFHQEGTTTRIVADEGIAAINPKVDVSASRTMDNEGEANTKDSFLTRITAEIIDVKPNGNLVVEAMTHVEHNDEKITLTLTGTISPEKVSATNTVESSSVARLTVTKKTTGVVRDGQKRGWLVRLMDAISPF